MTSKFFRTSWACSRSLAKNNGTTVRKFQYSTVTNAKRLDESKSGSTVDQEDVDRFTKHRNYWWDPAGPMKALHSMNLIRVPFVRDGLVQCALNERSVAPLKNKKILDVGCGGGILSEALAKVGADVTGVDANKDMIAIAQQHSELNHKLSNKPTYCCSTIEDHVKDHKNFYDGIVASEVIEHVNNKEIFVKSCIEALKPGGKIFFTTLNRTRMAQVFCIYFAEYVFNAIPKGTHQYEKFITPNELTFLVERNNCHVEAVYGTIYNILLNKWDYVGSQALMYFLQARKLKEEES